MKVLICGSRDWINKDLIKETLTEVISEVEEEITVIHGAARGADKIGGEVAAEMKLKVEEYPADWNTHGRYAGFVRNKFMVEECKPNVILAFWDGKSKGTLHTIKLAKKNNILNLIVKDSNGK